MPLSAQQKLQAAHTAAGKVFVVLPGCVLVLLSWSLRQVLPGLPGGGVLKAPARYKFHEGYTNVGLSLIDCCICLCARAIGCLHEMVLMLSWHLSSAGCQTPHAHEGLLQATNRLSIFSFLLLKCLSYNQVF